MFSSLTAARHLYHHASYPVLVCLHGEVPLPRGLQHPEPKPRQGLVRGALNNLQNLSGCYSCGTPAPTDTDVGIDIEIDKDEHIGVDLDIDIKTEI